MLEDYIRAFLKAHPSQRRVRADLAAMSQETTSWRQKVIPWEKENEMELLSLNREFKWVKQPPGRMLVGAFKSIYHEPMLAYAYKVYLKEGRFTVCFAATQKYQFIYQRQKSRTDFWIDGEHVGHITPDWVLYSNRKRMLGRRNRLSPGYYSVIVWDREAAHLRDPRSTDHVNPRVFEILEKLSDKEELLLMAVAFLTMIEESHGLGSAE